MTQRFADEDHGWQAPRCASTCCGVRWRAATASALKTLLGAHRLRGCVAPQARHP